jgi:outer membrane protein assembly factor BamB
VVADGKVFVSVNGNTWSANFLPTVIAVRATDGTELWQQALDGNNSSMPSFSGGTVFVVTHSQWEGGVYISTYGGLYALDASTGTIRWRNQLTDNEYQSPMISNGRIFVIGSTYSFSRPLKYG